MRPNLAPRALPTGGKLDRLGSPRQSRSISLSESIDASQARKPSGAFSLRVACSSDDKEVSRMQHASSTTSPIAGGIELDVSKSPGRMHRYSSAGMALRTNILSETNSPQPHSQVINPLFIYIYNLSCNYFTYKLCRPYKGIKKLR